MGAAACPAVILADNALSKLPKDVWIYTGLLAVVLLIGAAIIAVVERWRKRQANETFTAHDQLAQFRLLYERGELDPQEYERIKKQLLVKLKSGDPTAVAPEEIEPKSQRSEVRDQKSEKPPECERSEVRDQKSEQQSPDVPPPPADNGAEK